MKKFLKKVARSFHSGEKGFTLIELLIVIVILGVLAAAIIPNLSKFTQSGKLGAANAELAAVKTGLTALMSVNDGVLAAGVGMTGGGTIIKDYISNDLVGTYAYDDTGKVLKAGTKYPISSTVDAGLDKDGGKFIP